MKNYDLAILAYTTYGDFVDWKNYQGKPMPGWESLPEAIQDAWWSAADNVAFVVTNTDRANT